METLIDVDGILNLLPSHLVDSYVLRRQSSVSLMKYSITSAVDKKQVYLALSELCNDGTLNLELLVGTVAVSRMMQIAENKVNS